MADISHVERALSRRATLADRKLVERLRERLWRAEQDLRDLPKRVAAANDRIVTLEAGVKSAFGAHDALRAKAANLVVVESPLLGGHPGAIFYARLALLDSVRRGEVPLASHLLYPQVLDDGNSEDRYIGICAGHLPYEIGARAAVYVDLGISRGVQIGIDRALGLGRLVEYRTFGRQALRVLFRSGEPWSDGRDDPPAIRETFAKFGPAEVCLWP